MENESEAFAALLESHLSPMVEQLRAIPLAHWEWTPAPPVPSPRLIAEHTWHWLVCDRRHIQEPDVLCHPMIAEPPPEKQALCDLLAEENKSWRDLIAGLSPEHLADRRFQFGLWPRNVRYMIAHVTQQVIYKHGQLSTLFFWLELDGEGMYQAPFPNDDYSKLQQTLQNPLHSAVLRNDAASVQQELANGYDLALPTATGYTLLQVAVLHDHASLVHLLLEAGANGNETDRDGNSPLIHACFTGSTAAAQALITHRVDLHQTNRWNGDALGFARMKNNRTLVELLQKAGADQPSMERDTANKDAVSGS